MRILFYAPHPQATAGWYSVTYYRVELAMRELIKAGHAVFGAEEITQDASGLIVGITPTGKVINNAELVVFHGVISAPGGFDGVLLAREAGQVIVTDADALGNDDDPMTESVLSLIRVSDMAIVSTPDIRERVRAIAGMPPVVVIRNPIDVTQWPVSPTNSTTQPVLGWTGILSARANDCEVLRPWLGSFLEKHDLGFIHVGAEVKGSFARAANVDPARVEERPALPFMEYLASNPLSGIDVQLIPIIDCAWNRAKSCLKGMESAVCGVPFVASPHDEYKWFGCGRLAGFDMTHQEPKFWIAALESMLDPSERSRVATEARERVEREDIRVRWTDWETSYKSLLEHPAMEMS